MLAVQFVVNKPNRQHVSESINYCEMRNLIFFLIFCFLTTAALRFLEDFFAAGAEAAGSLLTAVSAGELTPIEATRVMGLIDSYRRTLELTEIEERLQALEHRDA
jgi:hypothetical protein